MKRVLWFVVLFIFAFISLSMCFLFLTKSGHELRTIAAESILSSQHRHWAKYTFLPQEELDKILKEIDSPKYVNSESPNSPSKNVGTEETVIGKPEVSHNELTVKIETIEKNINQGYYYKGKIMTVSNPDRVKLVSSKLENHGEQIFVIAERAKALAAVNASGFIDLNGHGNGGASTGVVIENGVIKNKNPDQKDYVAGLTGEGKLITGMYSAKEMKSLGVIQAAGFKPQLIVNGKKMITNGDGGWGIGPRTAMGQKTNGDIVFVVIDGRQTHSIGATIKEVQDILFERSVVNAMCMDGGSSSSMFFNGENVTTPSSKNNIPRYLPNIWAIIPESGDELTVEYDGKIVSEFNNINQ